MQIYILGLLSGFAAYAAASCLHGTTLVPRQLDSSKTKVVVSKFSYSGEGGPATWGQMNEVCATGNNQSPINLRDKAIKYASAAPVITVPRIRSAEFENLGSTVEVNMPEGATTRYLNKDYKMIQFHFHTPSEHLINGVHYPLEMHMVHQNQKDQSFLVVGLMFDLVEGRSGTALLSELRKHVGAIKQPGRITQTGPLDFAQVQNHVKNTQLYTYSGSLTTPPCKEGITFVIAKTPMPLDVASYNALKSTMGFNARFLQNDPGQPNVLEIAAETLEGGVAGSN